MAVFIAFPLSPKYSAAASINGLSFKNSLTNFCAPSIPDLIKSGFSLNVSVVNLSSLSNAVLVILSSPL